MVLVILFFLQIFAFLTVSSWMVVPTIMVSRQQISSTIGTTTILSRTMSSVRSSTTALNAGRFGGSGSSTANGKGPNKKKRNPTTPRDGRPSKKGSSSSTDGSSSGLNTPKSKTTTTSMTTASRAVQFNQKNRKQSSSQSNSPPWQVISKKDMAKNIQAEKKRRELAQTEGIHNVKEDVDYKVANTFLSTEDKALLGWKRFSQSAQDEIDFIGAYLNKQLPPRLGTPEVAFLGRSNVGKSSLLNRLVNSPMAKVGKTPGATSSVNLYGMFRNNKPLLGFVDLPGFGYAKLSKEKKDSVQETAEHYLGKRKELMLGILLVDIRRVPSDDDRAVLAALYDMGVPIIVVATKVDKVSKIQLEEALLTIQEGLGLPDGQPFTVSSVTGHGIKEMWRIIMEACEVGVAELNTKMEQGKEISLTSKPTSNYMNGEDDEEDDEEDISYSQGYDWIHDVYDENDNYDDDYGGDDYDFVEEDEDPAQQQPVVVKYSLMKSLRHKAKKMEKRGEL